jgi:hypothetical protein
MKELPCGCVRGEFMCPEAVRLWKRVNEAYEAKDLDAYCTAMKEYGLHVGVGV